MATITSMTRSGGTVSLTTSAAHGLVAGQGVAVSGAADSTFNGLWTAAAVGTSTTLTITATGLSDQGTNQTGTIVPTKEIVVLSTSNVTGGELAVTVGFWYPVPNGKELAVTRSSVFDRATVDENTALQAGRIIEDVRGYAVPSTYTNNQIQSFLQAMYAARLAYFNSQVPTGQYHGAAWNGAAWGQF